MNNDYILSVIREYADEHLKEPEYHLYYLSRNYFEQCSYQRWAVNEILKNIEESKFISPIMVVEDFIYRMDDFSCKNSDTSIIFLVAQDIAEDILDVLIAMS